MPSWKHMLRCVSAGCIPLSVISHLSPQALTDGHYQSAVALYAAQLPTDVQVKSYAHLLAGEALALASDLLACTCMLSGVHDERQQRHCLQLGKEAGLDIALVTKAVVENIRAMGTVSGNWSVRIDEEFVVYL